MDHLNSGAGGQNATPRHEPGADIRELLRELTVHQQDFERRLARHLGVDAAGLSVMNHLGSSGSATPTEIAHLLNTSTAATTLVLNRLEHAGHLTRNPHPTDRRKVVLTPNPDSLRAAYQVLNPIIDGVDDIVAQMDPDQRSVVAAFLKDMITLYAQQKPGTGH